MKNTEKILDYIGCHHRYQILLSVVYLVIGTYLDFSLGNLSVMVTLPKVMYINDKSETKIEEITQEICSKYDYTIVKDQSYTNWVTDTHIECKNDAISLLSSMFLVGNLLGLMSLQFLQNQSKENVIKYICIVYCASSGLLPIKNYYALILFNLMQGFAQLSVFLLRNSIITEIVCKDKRGLFMNMQSTSTLTSGLIVTLMMYLKLDWKLQYIIGCGVVLLFNIFNFCFIVTNPRSLMINNDFELATFTAEYIRKFNKMGPLTTRISSIGEESNSKINSKSNEQPITNEEELLAEDVIDQNSSLIKAPDSVIIANGKENEPSVLFRTQLLILFISCSINVIFSIYEGKVFNNYDNIEAITAISIVSGVFFFGIVTLMMNTDTFGRKYTIIVLQVLIISLRLIYIAWGIKNIYIFFVIRVMAMSIQIPQHTLITESFSNKGRVKYYSQLYTFTKIVSISSPYIIEMLDYWTYNVLFCIFAVISIVMLVFFIKETKGKELKDY